MKQLRTIEMDLQNLLDDYFYNKTKDFGFNDFEEDLKRQQVNEIAEDCIEDVLQSFKYFDDKLDDFLNEYELHREENLKIYEYEIKHSKY